MQGTRYLLAGLLLMSSTWAMGQTAHEKFARALVERQARAWETQNSQLAAADWLPSAILSSPEGNTPANSLSTSMSDYFKSFSDLKIHIKNLLVAPDGNRLAIEWDWEITRKRDGKRGISHDAILVDLKDGKIAGWREYYDPAASGEATP